MDKPKSFIEKIKSLYREFNEDTKTAYRLIEIISKDNQKFAVIGLRHSHLTFKQSLISAINDDALLAGLSYQDVRSLSMYAMFCSMQHKFELISIEYSEDDDDDMFFNIKDNCSGTKLRLSQDELHESPDILEHFKHDELYKVGYLCGNKRKR